MSLLHTMNILEKMDDPAINGEEIVALFESYQDVKATSTTVSGEQGSTDFVKIVIKGAEGKISGGQAPSLELSADLVVLERDQVESVLCPMLMGQSRQLPLH